MYVNKSFEDTIQKLIHVLYFDGAWWNGNFCLIIRVVFVLLMNSGQQLHTRKTKVNDIWDCELIRLSLSRMESDMVSGKSWGLVMCHPVAEPHSSSCPNHVDRVYTSSYVHQSSFIQQKTQIPWYHLTNKTTSYPSKVIHPPSQINGRRLYNPHRANWT